MSCAGGATSDAMKNLLILVMHWGESGGIDPNLVDTCNPGNPPFYLILKLSLVIIAGFGYSIAK